MDVAHTPAVGTKQGAFRVVVAALSVTALIGLAVVAARSDASGTQVRMVGASCKWRGDSVVVSGIVANPTLSSKLFIVTPTFSVAGRTGRLSNAVSEDVFVPAGSWKSWRWADGFLSQALRGQPITACVPTVHSAPAGD